MLHLYSFEYLLRQFVFVLLFGLDLLRLLNLIKINWILKNFKKIQLENKRRFREIIVLKKFFILKKSVNVQSVALKIIMRGEIYKEMFLIPSFYEY